MLSSVVDNSALVPLVGEREFAMGVQHLDVKRLVLESIQVF
jgi:hypothetical protein